MSISEEETTSSELVFMRRPAEENEGHHGGVWKIAYADFMTAMMAFFLVMWLINASDKKVITQIATYFNPVLLTNKAANPTAPHQSGMDAQGRVNSPSRSRKGNEHVAGNAETEENKPRYSEEALFADPYGILSKLADEAAGNLKRTGEAYRDPFDPGFRREAHLNKSEPDKMAVPPAVAAQQNGEHAVKQEPWARRSRCVAPCQAADSTSGH